MEKCIIIIGKGENMRVYQFAKELGKESGDFVQELKSTFKFDIKSHLSGITEEQMKEVKDFYSKEKGSSQITDVIGKEDAIIHHDEAMKESFNMDDSIKTNVEIAKSAREHHLGLLNYLLGGQELKWKLKKKIFYSKIFLILKKMKVLRKVLI